MRRRALLGAGGTFLLSGCMRLEESSLQNVDGSGSQPQNDTDEVDGPDEARETTEPEDERSDDEGNTTDTVDDEPNGADDGTDDQTDDESEGGDSADEEEPDDQADEDGDDAPVVTGTWPQFGNDAAHTGFTSAAAVTGKEVRWTARIGVGGEVGGPIVADGKVFLNETTALDAATGEVVWESAFTGFRPTPAYADGLVFTGDDSNLAAIDAETGDLVWIESFGTYGITVFDDHLYVRGSRRLAKFDFSGAEYWRVRTPSEYRGRYEPTCGDGIVCVAVYHTETNAGDGQIIAFDPGSGAQLWEYDVGAASKFPPLIAESRVFFGGRSETVRALDAADGSLLWEDGPGGGRIQTSPAFADGVVYVGDSEGRILGYDPATGERVYETTNQHVREYKGGIAVADGVVYAVSDGGVLTANDTTSGDLLWSHAMARMAPQQQWPAPVDGHVFISDGMGNVYAIGDET